MEPHKKDNLWSDIKAISQTQDGRQAMMTTGSVIAAAYMGYVGPELLATMHDALAFYALKYPLMDPQAMSSSLWGGAQFYSASALDYLGTLSEKVSLELSHPVRESVQTAREFLSRGSDRSLEAARLVFDETTRYVGSYAGGALQNIGTALHSGYNAIKEHWGAVVAVGAAIKEAYDFYTTGESIFKRIFKRGKKETGADTTVQANISVNIALGGSQVLASADRALKAQSKEGHVDIDMDQVFWISDQMRTQIAARACEMGEVETAPDADSPPRDTAEMKDRRIRVRAEVDKLLKSPEFNYSEGSLEKIRLATRKNANKLRERWDESPVSTGRLKSMQGQVRKTSLMEFDLTDPLAFVKGSLADAENGRDSDNDIFVAANDNNIDRPSGNGPGLM